ncbi:hypothetical protein BGW80DRAFT_399085 [Lactifluus volemus]|nr:hypothetical protein BGW80DRAFT_399085 [Lactifluus volemus]
MRLIRLISFPARETFTSTSLFLLVGVMALSTLRAFDCSSPSSSSLLVPTNYVVAYQHGHPFNCNDETSPMHGVSVFSVHTVETYLDLNLTLDQIDHFD